MRKQLLKLSIELDVLKAIMAKFPEADDVGVVFDVDNKELITPGLEKYLLRYDLDYRMKVRHEFLLIIDKYINEI